MAIKTLGQRAKAARERAHLTIPELQRAMVRLCPAGQVPPSDPWIRRFEADRHPDPKLRHVQLLATALGLTVGKLLGERQ